MWALLAQLDPVAGSVADNLARVEATLDEHPGVDLAIFPELFLSGYEPAAIAPLARSIGSEELARVRRAAAAHETAIVLGFAERTPAGDVANSAACVDADGTLAGVYRKTHLFGDAERSAFAPGEELMVLSLAGHRVAPLICFDMEFPEPARALARAGAELLVTIAANMHPYGPDHEISSRARALENRRPHLYVNRVGGEHGLRFVGQSCAIDSGGRTTASAGSGERLLAVEVPEGDPTAGDVDYLQHVREELPVRAAVLHFGEGGEAR